MPLLESEALVYTGSDGVVRFCQLTAKLSVFVLFKVCPSGISHCHVLICWVWLENHEITLCFHLVENIKVKFPINFGAFSCVVTEIYTSLKSPRKSILESHIVLLVIPQISSLINLINTRFTKLKSFKILLK